jgi:hypothetical protein
MQIKVYDSDLNPHLFGKLLTFEFIDNPSEQCLKIILHNTYCPARNLTDTQKYDMRADK